MNGNSIWILVTTSPSVIYKVKLTDGGEMLLDNPSNMPNVAEIEYMEEPVVEAHIMTPSEYVGTIMELCQDKRGVFKDMTYIEEDRVNIKYELPLNEIIYDFFDQLKSRSRGYASFDYELKEYVKSRPREAGLSAQRRHLRRAVNHRPSG